MFNNNSVHLVCVLNDPSTFQQAIEKNKFLTHVHIHSYDNRANNQAIPTRYNDFIDNHLPQDSWCIFCHQDFEFMQDPHEVLKNLDKNCIYGPIGVRTNIKQAVSLTFYYHRWKPSLHKKHIYEGSLVGQIHQKGNGRSFLNGIYITTPQLVDTLDCCCIMLHSSLIKKHHLRFDPTFDFHLYTEDFCLATKHKNIPSKAVQIECCHYSLGNLNDHFWAKYHQLLAKYPQDFFLTTCVSLPRDVIRHMLGKHYPAVEKLLTHSNLFHSAK